MCSTSLVKDFFFIVIANWIHVSDLAYEMMLYKKEQYTKSLYLFITSHQSTWCIASTHQLLVVGQAVVRLPAQPVVALVQVATHMSILAANSRAPILLVKVHAACPDLLLRVHLTPSLRRQRSILHLPFSTLPLHRAPGIITPVQLLWHRVRLHCYKCIKPIDTWSGDISRVILHLNHKLTFPVQESFGQI